MTPSEREVGRFEQSLADLKHRARNDRTVLIAHQEEIEKLRRELGVLRSRIYTALAVTAAFTSAAVWLVEFAVG